MEIFKLIIQVIISGAGLYALYIIGMDFYYNLSDIFKEKKLLLNGYSTFAKITSYETHYERPRSTTINYSTLRYVAIEYTADCKTYTNAVVLRDAGTDIIGNSEIEIIYDMNNPQNFILADGSTSKSAKNSIKWDLVYFFCTIILWLFLFLKTGTK